MVQGAYKNRRLKKDFVEKLPKCLGNITATCKAIGINRQTYYDWRDSDPEFRAACEDTSEFVVDFVEDKLMKLIDSMHPASVIFFLKCKAKNRGYIERSEVDVNDSRVNLDTAKVEELQRIAKGE